MLGVVYRAARTTSVKRRLAARDLQHIIEYRSIPLVSVSPVTFVEDENTRSQHDALMSFRAAPPHPPSKPLVFVFYTGELK